MSSVASGLCSASSSAHSMEPLEQSLQFKGGAVYTGSVKKGSKTRCGQGTFSWPSGLQYTGEFWDNKRHGTGVQVWPDGSKYEGGFKEDTRHGLGKHSWQNGEEYEGEYSCDKKHGHGRYTWPTGAYFCGHFEGDLREGSGVYVSPDGEKFEGVYHSDVRDGEGVLTYPGGRQDVGVWKGVKLVRLRFTVAEVYFDPSSPTPLGSPNSSLGTTDHRSRGKFGPKGPLEMSSEALLQAAASGNVAKVDAILKAGAVHIDVVDKMGHTALLAAAIHCQPAVIHLLLDNGADVNFLDDYGVSALNACYHALYAAVPEVQSFLSQLPSLKSYPAASRCSSPTTFTERTLHTCDLFSTTPGINGGDHRGFSSPLSLPEPRRRLANYHAISSFTSLRGITDQHSRYRPNNHCSSEEKDFLKSKSLGMLLVNHQLAICSSLPESKSFPVLPATSEDEKKVRFTPLITTQPQEEAKIDEHALEEEVRKEDKVEALVTSAPATSITPRTLTADSAALLPLTTPRFELQPADSRLSTSLGFGSILNTDQLPATASAASGEDILGVSALSGDYYSNSVPPEGESRLSQLSNVLPDEFDNESVTSLDQASPESPGSIGRDDQDEEEEDLLASSTPALASSPSSNFKPHYNNGLLSSSQPPTPLTKCSVHETLLEGSERRSSIFSSPQYGSIVSAAQSTSLSCGTSEQMDSVVSLTPPTSPVVERQLATLCTLTDSINLLLQRGADPNLCRVPLPPLFYAIRAGDIKAVQRVLNSGADTELCLPIEVGGHCPLHTAVTCLNPNSVEIVRALLEHGANPDYEVGVQAKKLSNTSIVGRGGEGEGEGEEGEEKSHEERLMSKDQSVEENGVRFCVSVEGNIELGADSKDEVDAEVDAVIANGDERQDQPVVPVVQLVAGDNPGRPSYTPLHLVCSTDTSSTTIAQLAVTSQEEAVTMLVAMVKLLIAHSAEVNRVARGHSPLSLAIINGHNQIVDVLLESGADPNQPLGRGVGTALCVLSTHQALKKRDLSTSLALVFKLMKHGANVLQNVQVTESGAPGTVTDFAYAAFKLDRRLDCLKYHSLTKSERTRYRAAKKLHQHFVCIFKCLALQTIAAKELSWQNIHKKDHHSSPTIELPCVIRQKLCRTTSSLFDSRNQSDVKSLKKRNKGRSTLSAGERPRNGPGMLTVSLPEHTLRIALENVLKAHSSISGGVGGKEGGGESDDEVYLAGTKQKGLKNGHTSGRNVMKLNEMFEKAKSLFPHATSLRCGGKCHDENVIEEEGLELVEKKEWTIFSFCYECGRTSGIHLVKCPGCRGVSYCSRSCRTDNWKRGHQKECTGVQVKIQDATPGKGRGVALHRTKTLKRTNSSMM